MFLRCIKSDIRKIHNKFKFKKQVVMRQKYKEDCKKATHCHICKFYLGEDKAQKYREDCKKATHCHICKFYLGEDKAIDHFHSRGIFRVQHMINAI